MDCPNPGQAQYARVADEFMSATCELRDRVHYMCGVYKATLPISRNRELMRRAYDLGILAYNTRCQQHRRARNRAVQGVHDVGVVLEFYHELLREFPTFAHFIEESRQRMLAAEAAFRLLDV